MKEESKATFEKRMKTITVPEGFTAEFGDDQWGYDSKAKLYRWFKLVKTEDTEIKFDINGPGHTRFKVGDGWRSFDRTGVEDSFYHVSLFKGDKVKDLDTIVTEQLKRIAERREYYTSAISVPGLPDGGWTVSPDGVAGLKDQVKKNGHVTFTPSGFGIGYLVAKRPQRGCRYGESRAKPELEAFLGHSPLYVSTMDCD